VVLVDQFRVGVDIATPDELFPRSADPARDDLFQFGGHKRELGADGLAS
jgi:hypothetical protein